MSEAEGRKTPPPPRTQPVSAAADAARERPAAARAGARPPAVDPRAARDVVCTWCDRPSQVAVSAKSVVCPHCNKRLVVEDFRTASYHAVRLLATCGDVFVDKRGHVVAAVRASNIAIDGKLTGNIVAHGCVTLGKGASVKGDIDAARLRVESGAVVNGFVRIGVAGTLVVGVPGVPGGAERPDAPPR